MNLLDINSYSYAFDESLIATQPIQPKDRSRLMIVNRATGEISEIVFHEIVDFFSENDTFIFNDTKVIPARLIGKRESGGESEIFLIKNIKENIWEVLAKPGKKLRIGVNVIFGNDFYCKILDTTLNGTKIVEFFFEKNFEDLLQKYGKIPLPHYMNREADERDNDTYQTIFAKNPGAAAAPTAGLHFTQDLLNKMHKKSILQEKVTLHVGLGTFNPVRVNDLTKHEMHRENGFIDFDTADRLNEGFVSSKKQICVGTTCCRLLESSIDENRKIKAGNYETNIFIYPGYEFKFVRSLLTNFHLPQSTLLMLVCALGGYDLIMEAYKKAVKEKYRFFSYGDAMLIL